MKWLIPAAAPALLAALACGSSGGNGSGSGGDAGGIDAGEAGAPAQSIFVVPSSLDALDGTHFLDHPWPSDYRRDSSGAIVVKGLYNPFGEPIIQTYLTAVTGKINGFSTVAYGYLRFQVDLDPTTLPASPGDTLAPGSTVQIIDVDPASPEHDQRHLAQIFWQQAVGNYWDADTLVVGPALGYPLLPKTRYAIVVTRGVKGANGVPIAPSPDLAAVLGLAPTTPQTQPVHDLYAPAVADLAALGVPASSIAHLAVFTTNDPTEELFSIADDLPTTVAAPTVKGALQASAGDAKGGVYDVYLGTYGPSPNYQQGTAPYTSTGGDFVFAQGHAVVQGTFDPRFVLVVPDRTACPMPAAGYPILIYAHGTGGSARSVIDEKNGAGDAMARQCIASIGTDQIFHGTRPGAPAPGSPNPEAAEEIAVFNFENPSAIRTNTRQSAIDVMQEARLFTETRLTVPASVAVAGAAVSFDPAKILFMGHSQGGLNGPLYLAADRSALGGVLSGSSSSVPITLLDKTSPSPSVAGVWLIALGLTVPSDAAELNIFHPIMSFAQTVVDLIDPLAYEPYLVRRPRPGHAPKSIFQTEGVRADGTGDTYAPAHGIEVGSVAIGLPRQAPGIHAVAEAPWGGLGDVTIPAGGLPGNLAGGGASGVLAQFVPPPTTDGHFVFFNVPACRNQAAQFCRNLADDPRGKVPAPGP